MLPHERLDFLILAVIFGTLNAAYAFRLYTLYIMCRVVDDIFIQDERVFAAIGRDAPALRVLCGHRRFHG